MSIATTPSVQNRAIVMMVLAILCFTAMDASVKALTSQAGVVPALWARYAGQMAVVLILVAPRLSQVIRTRHPGTQILRSVLLLGTTLLFFTALARMPLHDAATLMAINPVLITLGAGLFLGEALGPRRKIGIVVSMIGALIVLRPGSGVFTLDAVLPVGAALCYSGYALLTRKVGRAEDPWTSLFYTGLVGTLVTSAIVPFFWQPLGWQGWCLFAMVAGFGTLAQMLLIRAFTLGEAAMLAPYSYSGLIFAMLWSALFFGAYPDLWTVCGALVIAGAGLYVWHRETQSR